MVNLLRERVGAREGAANMHAERIWYLVMNSNRARILRGLPLPHEAVAELSLQSRPHHLRDHLQDRPTRSYSTASPGRRSAVEPGSDPVRDDTLRFLRDVQEFLTAERISQAFDALVVVAPPETLGLWRDGLKEPLQSAIRAEVPKNLIRQSAPELVETLRQLRDGA